MPETRRIEDYALIGDLATVDAIRRDLTIDGLVQRYASRSDGHVDGLPAGEGVFLACSFWLAEVLALQGKQDEARELFERLLGSP